MEIDLNKVRENTAWLAIALGNRRATITGVTKGVGGNPAVARAMLEGGATQLADSRLSNISRMRMAGISCPMIMIRSPLAHQISGVIKYCEVSYNSDLSTIKKLSNAAIELRHNHGVVLIIEMGDGRDGILPIHVPNMISEIKNLPGISLVGLATNAGCLNGAAPSIASMLQFTDLVVASEKAWGRAFSFNSTGGSSALSWALSSSSMDRVENLRLGESIFFGIDPITHDSIQGLHQDAVALFAEIIESTPTDITLHSNKQLSGDCTRLVLAIGTQDTDISGLQSPRGVHIIGATSDHMIVHSSIRDYRMHSDIKFSLNYSALARASNSYDVKIFVHDNTSPV